MSNLRMVRSAGKNLEFTLGPETLGVVGSFNVYWGATSTGSFSLVKIYDNLPSASGLPVVVQLDKTLVGLAVGDHPLIYLKAVKVDPDGAELETEASVTPVPTARILLASREQADEEKMVVWDETKEEFILLRAADGKLKVDASFGGSVMVDLDKDGDSVSIAGSTDGGTTFVFSKITAAGVLATAPNEVDGPPAVLSSIDATGDTIDVTGTTSVLIANTGTVQVQVGDDEASALLPLPKAEKSGTDFDFSAEYFAYFVLAFIAE